MNMSKLAKLAGVSVSTVSKVFSGSNEISESTKSKVIEAAKKAGCYEKYFKPQYLKNQIAVICPEILGIHYSKLATDIENEICKYNSTMLLSITDFNIKLQNELIEYYSKYLHVDGIIVIDPCGKIKKDNDTPIVSVGGKNENSNIDNINMDITNAMDASLQYITKNGHTEIGFIGETFAENEYNFFIDALKRNNLSLDPQFVQISDKRFYDAGYYGMDSLIKNNTLPSVLYAAYSHVAVGIIQRAKESGYRIPEDISLICMDDIQSIPYPTIALSSIRMHLDDLASIAVKLLVQRISDKQFSARQSIIVKREFIKGESIKLSTGNKGIYAN